MPALPQARDEFFVEPGLKGEIEIGQSRLSSDFLGIVYLTRWVKLILTSEDASNN